MLTIDRIHILGASGSGTSTLGSALAHVLPHALFDSDDYFWVDKFTVQRAPEERVRRLREDLAKHGQWMLSGAVCGWGEAFKPCFDGVVYLAIPQAVRLRRLREREFQRYGNEILRGGSKYAQSQTFLEWAAQYETGGPEMRSKVQHERWMSGLACPVLRLEDDLTVQARVDAVLRFIGRNA